MVGWVVNFPTTYVVPIRCIISLTEGHPLRKKKRSRKVAKKQRRNLYVSESCFLGTVCKRAHLIILAFGDVIDEAKSLAASGDLPGALDAHLALVAESPDSTAVLSSAADVAAQMQIPEMAADFLVRC